MKKCMICLCCIIFSYGSQFSTLATPQKDKSIAIAVARCTQKSDASITRAYCCCQSAEKSSPFWLSVWQSGFPDNCKQACPLENQASVSNQCSDSADLLMGMRSRGFLCTVDHTLINTSL